MSPRLPLAVGSSSLWSVARTAGALVPGLVLVASAVISLTHGFRLLAIVGGIVGVYLSVFGLQHIRRAWQARSSDACLTDTGLRIDGGPHHGLHVAWADIDPATTRTETLEQSRLTLTKMFGDAIFLLSSNELELAPAEKVPLRLLYLVTKDGTDRILARAEHPAEQKSLDALLETIQAKLGASKLPAPTLPPEVVGCSNCGAPVPPDDDDDVQCRFCGTQAVIPEALRQRVRAHRNVSAAAAATAASVVSLLDQPGATRANGVLLATAIAAVFIWIPIVVGLWWAGVSDAGAFEVVWGLVAGALLVLVVFVFARAALASRRALRLLTASFGARAPERDGGAPGCRRCAGPLPPTDELIVACVYCEADNLMGLDLRSRVAKVQEHQLSLEQVVAARNRERRRWRWTAVAVLPVAVLAGGMAISSVVVAQEFRAQVDRCEAGDAEACYDVSIEFDLGISVAEDDAKAWEYAARACEMDHAEACWTAAQDLYWGWGTEEDPEAAESVRVLACEFGVQDACAGF